MFILINGAFGIGKTTTATALARDLPSAVLYDPEPLGGVLQRASAYLRPGGRIDDYQDLASWRHLTAWAARYRHRRYATVIVPMAFTNRVYLDALVRALGRTAEVRTYCLVAPLPVVLDRLRQRAEAEGAAVDPWAARRAADCCRAHVSPQFGQPVDATMQVPEIVRVLVARRLTDRAA